MRKILNLLVIFTFAAALFTGLSCGKNYGDEKGQILCPVMGNKIDRKFHADYKGKRIYFCCEGCISDFKKDPEKYMKILNGVKLEDSMTEGKKAEMMEGEHNNHEGHNH